MSSNNLKETLIEYFSMEGRITRETYVLRVIGRWIAQFTLVVFAIFLEFLISAIYSIISSSANFEFAAAISFIFIPIIFLVILIFFVFKMVQEIKRLHDMNTSGWFIIFGFIPLINLIYYLLLILSDGAVGPNKYGKDPKGREPKTANFEEDIN
jgi:Predicted membrane protein